MLRFNTSLAWTFAILFAAQLCVPLALAMALPERGGVGIIICTSTGIMQLNANGDLVPVGEDNDQQQGQSDCLVCLTSGLTDTANLTPPVTPPTRPLAYGKQDFQPGRSAIPVGQLHRGFNARAPPACA